MSNPAPKPSWTEAVHTAGLAALAFSQPLLDLLGRNPTYFVAHRASGVQIVLFGVLVAILVPWTIALFERAVALLSTGVYRAVHTGVVGALAGAFVAPPLGRAIGLIGWLLGFVVAAVAVAVAYRKWPAFRGLLTPVGSLLPALFFGLFVFGGVRGLIFTEDVQASAGDGGKDIPLVFVLLDEIPIGSMLKPDLTIDEKRFPNFAEIESTSTWYRNASTSAESTQRAVPSLLTGKLAKDGAVPDVQDFPDNLFTLLGRSRALHVNESLTQLCPTDLCRRDGGSFGLLVQDSAYVFLHFAMPKSVADAVLPPLGDQWAGFAGDEPEDDTARSRRTELRGSLAQNVFTAERIEGFSDVARSITDAPRDVWYMHAEIPHRPYQYLPDGRRYTRRDWIPGVLESPERWPADRHVVDMALQRYMLQAKLGDALLGEAIDRMKEAGIYDEALVVVAGDHGVSFEPKTAVRKVNNRNAADIIFPPLYIKYPGQQDGKVDERFAEHLDVLPTIADVLDIDIPWDVKGVSLRTGERDPAGRTVAKVPNGLVRFPIDVPDYDRLPKRVREVFGSFAGDDDIYSFRTHDLVGKHVDDLDVDDALPDPVILADKDNYEDYDPGSSQAPVFVTGSFVDQRSRPAAIAVALNGTIAGTGWTFVDPQGSNFAVLLSPKYLKPGNNDVTIYAIERDGLRAFQVE